MLQLDLSFDSNIKLLNPIKNLLLDYFNFGLTKCSERYIRFIIFISRM